MGLVSFVISSVGKCLDAVCLVLDVNFLIVHTVLRTLMAAMSFINSLPSLLLNSAVDFGDVVVFGVVSSAEAASSVAHVTVGVLGSLVPSLEGLLESLKMVGYLSMHVLLRGKELLCRGLLAVFQGCGIAVSLVVYFANTVVNFALIATQNMYLAAVSVYQTATGPLQKALELLLTSFTFLYSILVWILTLLLPLYKLVLDFMFSLVHMFISIFLLNTQGLLLTVTIALTTTAYLNPELTRATAVHVLDYINSFPALRRICQVLHHLTSSMRSAPHFIHGAVQSLPRILHHLSRLERELKRQLSRLSSLLGLARRRRLHMDNNNRVHGDGDPGEERRDPPDGRAEDGAGQELLDLSCPSTSADGQLKKQSSSGKESKPLTAEDLLSLLKEQEDRKKCVICQDCTKTVVLLPCRHLCLCRDCTNILMRQTIYSKNCPLCRDVIFNTMDVYL